MRSGTWRHLYDVCFIGGVVALAYLYRGMYRQVESLLEPHLQAYTTVGMLLIILVLFLLLNYLREAIANTFTALVRGASGGTPLRFDSGKHSHNVLRTARRLRRRGDYQAAGEAYEALEMWTDAASVYERGNIFSRAAQAWEKAQNPGRAIELYEKDANYETAAQVCLQEGITERARKNYRLAAEVRYEQNQLVLAAELYVKAEDYQKAASIFEQAHKPDRALAAYEHAGNADKILQILKAMPPADYLRRGPAFTQLVERCAEILYRAEHVKEAAEILEQAHAYTRAAEIYAACGMPERAAEIYLLADSPEMAEAVVAKMPQTEATAELRARLAMKRGDWLAAGQHFEKAGKMTQAVDAYKKGKEFEAAAHIYEEMGRYILAGEMYSSGKNFTAAANAYAKAYDWRNAAECFEASNDLTQAVEAHANAANYLKAGKIALRLTDYARAVEYLQRIPSGSPDEVAGTAFLGAAFFYQSHLDMAYELFARSMDRLPLHRENLPAWYAWAQYLEKYDPKQSLTHLRQIMTVDVNYADVAARARELEQIVSSIPRDQHPARPHTTPGIVQQRRPDFTLPHSAVPPVAASATYLVNQSQMTRIPSYATSPGIQPPTRPAAQSSTEYPTVAARYQITSPTRHYGRLVDYAAIDTQTNTTVALRTFPRPSDPMVYQATKELIANAQRLSHPGMATVTASGEDGELIYVVSEVTPGQTLQQMIRTGGPMSVSDARQFFLPLLQCLDYAHSNDVCHLNLRPELIIKNVVETSNYTITGFGVPVRQPASTETMYNTSPDTDPQYMAPEQIMGSDVDSRTDIYAMGLLLFFVLTGRTPFEAKRVQDTQEIARMQVQTSLMRPSSMRATLPTAVDEIFLKCVYKSPTSRYQSVGELMDDLTKMQTATVG
jgi:tetratricopeptide (TPR) repeat protein